jgi:raffinose/stachyose/melibiose transport system permease protein
VAITQQTTVPAPQRRAETRRPTRSPGSRRALVREVVLSTLLMALGLAWIYPFLWMVSASLKDNTEIFGDRLDLIPKAPQWENYARAWYDAEFGQTFFNTVFISVTVIVIVVISTGMIGYVIGRYAFPGRKAIFVGLVATIIVPEGYTIIPIFDLINNLGLGSSLFGIILAEAGGANVISILLFAGYFGQLPKDLEEAARIDGAGFFRIFWQVMLPLAKPVIATVVILTLLRTWNSFLLPLVLTLAQPELRTLAVGVYSFQGEYFTDWSGMAAASTISLAPIIGVFLLMQRYFIEGISGAIRG